MTSLLVWRVQATRGKFDYFDLINNALVRSEGDLETVVMRLLPIQATAFKKNNGNDYNFHSRITHI